MDAQTPSGCFPNELYSEILQHLHRRRDTPVLLSLALVNQALRHESQKILFSNVDGGGLEWREDEPPILIHTLFLQAVINDPKRLGPYVLTYRQDGVACDPDNDILRDEDPPPLTPHSVQLWKLTKRALPEMINLRHFFFIPKYCTPIPSANLLHGCSFQLQTFAWKFIDDMPSHVAAFLCTQTRLLHCEVVYELDMETLVWLPTNSCPNLISTTIHCQFLPALIHRKNIVALDLDIPTGEYSPTEDNHTILRRLKYLSVKRWMLDVGFPGIVLSNIIVLDIFYWWGTAVEHLSSFPGLKVLILRIGGLEPAEDIEKHVVLPSFQKCPLLERVICHPIDNISYYTTFTGLRSEGETQTEVKVQMTEYEHDVRRFWWTRYDV